MGRSKKPYLSFETSEDFDKWYNEIFNSGREKGFEEGSAYVMSHVLGMVDDVQRCFDQSDDVCDGASLRMKSEYLLGERRRVEYEKRKRVQESIKEEAVKKYIESQQKKAEG